MPDKKTSSVLAIMTLIVLVSALVSVFVISRPSYLSSIAVEEKNAFQQSLREILPAFDNSPWDESFDIMGTKVYPARREEKVLLTGTLDGIVNQEPQTVMANALKGFAFQIDARDGEGKNPVWIGVDLDGVVTGFRPGVRRQARVPENFTGKPEAETPAAAWTNEAVLRGREFFEMHRNFFLAAAHDAQPGETA